LKSPANMWAVGYPSDTTLKTSIVLHYDVGGWREVFTPGENKYVYDVAMYNKNNGWAVGAEKVGGDYYGRTWQCRNGVWFERVCPVEEPVGQIEFASAIEAWALTSKNILHYTTESNVVPASLGRIKALYAAAPGDNATRPPAIVAPVPAAPVASTRTAAPSRAEEPSADVAD
jgi:hypothetical protein